LAVSKAKMEDKALLSIYSELPIGAPLLETISSNGELQSTIAL